MVENKYFKQALSDFVLDAAGGGAIRHLVKQGLTVRQIADRLDFPIAYEKVRQMVWDALVEQEIILLEEPGAGAPVEKAVYVKEQGEFGRTSFRRIVIAEEDYRRSQWKESVYEKDNGAEFYKHLSEACAKNGRETAYASCSFGILQAKDEKQYQELLKRLEDRQKEYVEQLPWPRRRVYHRLDLRFSEILENLVKEMQYSGCCYFLETGEKLIAR